MIVINLFDAYYIRIYLIVYNIQIMKFELYTNSLKLSSLYLSKIKLSTSFQPVFKLMVGTFILAKYKLYITLFSHWSDNIQVIFFK